MKTQKKIEKIALAIAISTIFLISFASATIYCNKNAIITNYTAGTTKTEAITCNNTGNLSVSFLTSGNYFTLSDSSIGQGPSTKTITITFFSTATEGLNIGSFGFSDGSNPIPLVFNVLPQIQQVAYSPVTVFPTSKVTTVKQGYEKTQNILITVPQNHPSIITIQAVNFIDEKETIKFGDLNLGQIIPGQTASIPIVFSAIEAQVGTYQTQLEILASNSTGRITLPQVSLIMQVTQGITPITNNTFSTRPSCTLSATTLHLNGTYTFTCSGINNNINVEPVFNEFYDGINVDISSGIYTYTFKPTRMGNFDFIADFKYQGSRIFNPFIQEVKVQSTGANIGGTNLEFLFYPSLNTALSGQEIRVQLIDNESKSLVDSPHIYVDGIALTGLEKSFKFTFEGGEKYEFRGESQGYTDIIRTIELTSKPINVIITPASGNSDTIFNITSNTFNFSLFIDGIKKDLPFIDSLSAGKHEIRIIREGFLDGYANLTVDPTLMVSSAGTFSKGKEQTLTLNKNVSWSVTYQKDFNSVKQILLQDNSDKIIITPRKNGYYYVEWEDGIAQDYYIEGWDWKFLGFGVGWWVLLAIVAFGGFIYYRNHKEEEVTGFGGRVNVQEET